MMEEDETEIDLNLFAAMHRVSRPDDLLHRKIVTVMGDYVDAQSSISDTIYLSRQDREQLLGLFPPRRLDISYHGFGQRHRVVQPSVKVTPLKAPTPKTSLPPTPPTSFQPMAMISLDLPKRMQNDTEVKVHNKKQLDDCISTELNSAITSSLVIHSQITPSSVSHSTVTPCAVTPSSVTLSPIIHSQVIPSTVTLSSLTHSAVTPSSVTSSSVTHSQVTQASVSHSTVTTSAVTPSVILPSVINSEVTSSVVTPSSVNPSLVTHSQVTPSSVTHSKVTPSAVTHSLVTPSSVTPSSVIPSPVTDPTQQPSNRNGAFSKSVCPLTQHKVNEKYNESLSSKLIEGLSVLNEINQHQSIDISDIIKEITLPPLISPISPPEVQINVDTVFKEMTNVLLLSPISNPGRQYFTAPKKIAPKCSSAGDVFDKNPILSPCSVQNIIGDISSSSEEEQDAPPSTEPPLVESTPPKPASVAAPTNVLSFRENKLETCNLSTSNKISSRKEPEMKKPKDFKNNLKTTNLLKIINKIPRRTITNTIPRINQKTRIPCSNVKIPTVNTVLENSDKESRPIHYPKEFPDFNKRPSSFDTFKLPNKMIHKKKIAPPNASQIVSRPKQLIPNSMQDCYKPKPPSNLLSMSENKTNYRKQPMKQNFPKPTIPIGLAYPEQERPQKRGIVKPRTEVPITVSNAPKVPCISKTLGNEHQSLRAVPTAEQKPSPTASQKDGCGTNKIDLLPARTQSPIISVTKAASLPISQLSNHSYNSKASDCLDNESQLSTLALDEKSLTLNTSPEKKPFSLCKSPPYSLIEKSKSTNEYEKMWLPPNESDKKMPCRKLAVSPYKLSPSSPKIELSFTKFKKKKLQVKINLELLNGNYRKMLVCQHSKRATISRSGKRTFLSSPSLSSNSSYKPRRKIKGVSTKKKMLINLDTNLLSYIPSQSISKTSVVSKSDDKGPMTKRLCTTSLIQDQRQSQQETVEVDGNLKALLQESSESCYFRAKCLKDQAKIMKKEAQMFLHLLAANWFLLCSHQMEKEGRSLNAIRRHLISMTSFLNEIGTFQDVRMEVLRSLLQVVVYRKSYELSSSRRQQLQTELNVEYKSIFGPSLLAPENAFRRCLDQHRKTSGKSVSVSYGFLQTNREYQSLIELLVKSEELLSKVRQLMQTKRRFFDLVKSRWQNVSVCLEIPLIVDFVKTCTELLQPKELGIIIKAHDR